MNKVRELMLQNTPDNIWEITAVRDAHNAELPKFVKRNREGAFVRALLPLFEYGMPLRLMYTSGKKQGGVFQHSRIARIEEVPDSERLRVFTAHTMVELELVVVEYIINDLIEEHNKEYDRDPATIILSEQASNLWLEQLNQKCGGTLSSSPIKTYAGINVHRLIGEEGFVVRVQDEEV